MPRVISPPDVTPQELDTMFGKLLKLPLREERAVRLRLQGRTYQEIAAILNGEGTGGENPISQMWVLRKCHSAKKKMGKVLSKAGRLDPKDPATSIYETASKIASALDKGKQPFPRELLLAKPAGRRKKLYLCHTCRKPTLEARPDPEGRRNTRIHICLQCGRRHTTEERNSYWSYGPLDFSPQTPRIPKPGEK